MLLCFPGGRSGPKFDAASRPGSGIAVRGLEWLYELRGGAAAAAAAAVGLPFP